MTANTMEPSSIEICVGCFVPDGDHKFRLFDAAEVVRLMERIDVEALRERGVYFDPFDLAPFGQRERYTVAGAAELPEGFDPFDVADLIKLVEEEIIEWHEADYTLYQKSVGADRQSYDLNASLGAADRWLAARDPFRVTTQGRQGP